MSTATVATIAAVLAVSATEAPKYLECVTETVENDIIACNRTLHTKVLTGLQQVGIKPLFNDKFGACSNEDIKNLHEQARIILRQATKVRWNAYSKAITDKIQCVVDTYMATAREDKSEWDKLPARMQARCPFDASVSVPFSDLVPCFPEGKDDTQIFAELHKLFPNQVVNSAPKSQKELKRTDLSVSFSFIPAPAPKGAEVGEDAPKSGESPISAARNEALDTAAE